MCPQETDCPPSAGLEVGYCTTGMVSDRWNLDTKGNAVKSYHKFWPNISPKCRRENIFWVLARRMTTFRTSNHYINTFVQKAGIPGFPGYLEHSQMIWNSILSAKRYKTELHVIWLDLANAYGSVLHHLIRIALEFFNFPSKVGEIIMKYFNSAFMKFTVKNYTTKWQALEIGIMIGCVISPLLFVLAIELILQDAANTSKGVMKMNIWLFLLPELLWTTSPFSSRPKSLPRVYYRRIMTFSHRQEWRLSQRKVIVSRRICQGGPFQNWWW